MHDIDKLYPTQKLNNGRLPTDLAFLKSCSTYFSSYKHRTSDHYAPFFSNDLYYNKVNVRGKEKGKKSIYIAPFTVIHSKRSSMDHTVLSANNTMPAFPS